jgi:nucleotide-binding universal stress UspA family protein
MEISMSPSQSPNSPPPPRSVLLVAIDMSPDAEHVVASAVDLARRTPGAELHIVHAVDPRTAIRAEASGIQPYDAIVRSHADFLDNEARKAREDSAVTVVGHLVEDGAQRAILQTAASIDADMVVVGTHGRRGIARWTMGSIAEMVVRKATCPVFVVREKQHNAPQIPEIEPPCPDCVEVQRATGGAKLWCARHSQHHPRAHLHYENPPGFGGGSSLFRG